MGGKVYGGTGNIGHLFVHDPATGRSTDLGKALGGSSPNDYGVYALTVGLDGMIYGGTGYYDSNAQFFCYDPVRRQLLHQRTAVAGEEYIYSLATGADGKIYGGTGGEGCLFVYNPSDGSLNNRGSGMNGWSIMTLTRGPGAEIYGGTSGGYLFRYDPGPGTSENLGSAPAASTVLSLVAGQDGRIYGGTSGWDGHLFSYEPGPRRFTDLGLVQYEDSEISSLLVLDNGVIYGGTGWRSLVLFSYNPADHPYAAAGTYTSLDIVPAIQDRGRPTGTSTIYGLAQGADGRVYVGGNNGHLTVYDPSSGQYQDLGQAVQDEWVVLSLTTGPDGKIYGGTGYSAHLFVYDPATGLFTDLGRPAPSESYVRRLVTGRDGKIYGGTEGYGTGTHGRLFVYDPATGQKQDLGSAVADEPYVEALTAGLDGKIYGGTGYHGRLFRYDPVSRRFTDLGQPVRDESYVDSLATGPDGTIWGGTWPNAHLFCYYPNTGIIMDRGRAIAEDQDIYALAVAPDGTVYGGTSYPYGILFRYHPGLSTFTRLGRAVPGDQYIFALLMHDNGLLYGGGGTSYCSLFTYDPAFLFQWDLITYHSTVPASTGLKVDVLDMQNRLLAPGLSSGGRINLDSRTYPALRLRANLSTSAGNATPRLSDWRVSWAEAAIALWPQARIVETGSVLTLDVQAVGVTNLGRFQFTLTFNPAVLRADGATLGTFLGSTGRSTTPQGPTIDNGSGTVTFGATSTGSAAGRSGTGTLAVITFHAQAPGTANLGFSSVELADVPGNLLSPLTTGSGTVIVANQVSRLFLPVTTRAH